MKLEDLTKDERTAMGRLIRLVVRIDGSLSKAERQQIDDVAVELGEDLFWDIVDGSKKSSWNFTRCVRAVERQPARELIYGALLGIAMVGTLEPAERETLERVAAGWDIEDVPESPDDEFDDEFDDDEDYDEDEDEEDEDDEFDDDDEFDEEEEDDEFDDDLPLDDDLALDDDDPPDDEEFEEEDEDEEDEEDDDEEEEDDEADEDDEEEDSGRRRRKR